MHKGKVTESGRGAAGWVGGHGRVLGASLPSYPVGAGSPPCWVEGGGLELLLSWFPCCTTRDPNLEGLPWVWNPDASTCCCVMAGRCPDLCLCALGTWPLHTASG